MKQFFFISSLIILGLAQGCKTETAQWRGVNRDGVFHETGLMNQWPKSGPELLWVYEGIGRGFAAPAVLSDKLFINGEEDGKSYLFAFETDGALLWKSPNGEEFLGEGFSSTYPGARATPTVVGNRVYTTSGKGRIACFNAKTGSEKWARHILDDLGGELGYFGYSESVAVDQDLVYCFPGGTDTNLAALDRYSGKTVWSAEVLRDTFSYGSPVLVDLPEGDILIHTSRHNLFTIDRSNGELLGSYELAGFQIDGEHCNTPIYNNGFIYYVANDIPGQGAIKLELSEDGKTISEVWRNQEIHNNFGGQVTVDGNLFTTIKGNKLVSLDSEDGSVYDSLRVANGSIIFADNKFIIYGNNGTINLVSYDENQLEAAGTLKVEEGSGLHFSHPVIANGVLYIRHGDALMAYRI